MANVAHSTLTGSNLHEPKGIAAQTAGKVYVSDGAASGAWTSLAGAQNPFGSALLHVTDTVSSGTAAQILISNSWAARRLQTVNVNQITGASLVSNTITLPAGTYWIEFSAAWFGNASSAGELEVKTRFRNVTDGTDASVGFATGGIVAASGAVGSSNSGANKFTIASAKDFQLQTYCGTTTTSVFTGGSAITASSSDEMYANVAIWKIL